MDRINRTWQVRDYREGDEHQILQLRKVVFGDVDPIRLALSTWYWQFRDNPAGKAFCCLAEDDGKIVGQYVVIPTRVNFYGKEVRFALSCDTMTHPDYRKQGMFVTLAKTLYRSLESKHNITTVWGFPNDISLPGFTRRLNWNVLSVFPLRILPIRPLEMIRSHMSFLYRKESKDTSYKISHKPRHKISLADLPITNRLKELTIEPVEKFDASFDELWHQYKDTAPVMQIRDSMYLNWRYLDIPAFDYRPFSIKWKGKTSGYMVIRLADLMGHMCGVLVDLFPFPVVDDTVSEHLVQFARDYCKAHRAEFLTCLMSFAQTDFWKKVGLRKIPEWLNPRKWYLGCRYLEKDKQYLEDIRHWYVTYGDTDII